MHPLCHPFPGEAIPCTYNESPTGWSVNSIGQRPTPPLLALEQPSFFFPCRTSFLRHYLFDARHVRALGKPRNAGSGVMDADVT